MKTQVSRQSKKDEEPQSGKQVAVGIAVFIIGLSAVLLLLKYLIG